MADWKVVAAAIRGFEGRKEVMKALRRSIREPVPGIRRDVRDRALASLPRRGGLNSWVAASRLSASVKATGRVVGLLVKAGRNSRGGRSDIRAIDRGRVRAPSWGRRYASQWHTQTVRPGFFTDPARAAGDEVGRVTTDAVDRAYDQIRRL